MEKWDKLPIFKKAMDIKKLVDYIVGSVENTDIDFEDEYRETMMKDNMRYLRENAITIPSKIAGVADEDTIYDLKMENAAIIRKAARELITDARGIQMHGFKQTEYLDLLRTEVEEFRVLFAEWVKTFDCWNYSIDRWGLFNPPGVNYDDHIPDDDIPFDASEFFGDDDDDL